MRRAIGLALLAATWGENVAHAQTQEQRLTPTGAITSDIFGYDVDFDGTTVVGGAPFGTYSGFTQPGRAFVFEHNGSAWVQTQKLQPTPLGHNLFFGVRLAVDGDVIAISATGSDAAAANAGAVYVFERIAGVWQQIVILTAPDATADAGFGAAVALQGGTLLIGAPGDTNAGGQFAGALYVYERVGGIWMQQQKILSPDPAFDDNFGAGLAIDGDRAVVGALDDDHSDVTNAGAAYVLERSAGVWSVGQKLIAATPSSGSAFGQSVTLAGETIVVGAHQYPAGGAANAGAAYVFHNGPRGWEETARIEAADAASGDHFGVGVSMNDARLLIGSYLSAGGAGQVYSYRRAGGSWEYDGQFSALDPGGILTGWRIALGGDRAAVAAPFYLTNRGAVYVFTGLTACAEDLNGDGVIDQGDLAQVLASYESDDAGDVTGDGSTDQSDLAQLLAAYGATCP